MHWLTPKSDPHRIAKSADGYYAIAKEHHGEYGAFSIEAVWSRPIQLSTHSSVEKAKMACEQHWAGMIAQRVKEKST